MIHELKNEGKRVFLGGINTNKRYETLAVIAEVAACRRFPKEPLPAIFREGNTTWLGSISDSPSRWEGGWKRNFACGI